MDEMKKEEIIEIKPEERNQVNPIQNTETKKEEIKDSKNGLCIASMVLGIVSLVFMILWFISIPCAILALIFGCIGLKSSKKGMAIAGIVTGGITFILMVLLFTFLFVFGFTYGFMSEFSDSYDHYSKNSYRNYHSSYYDNYE